MDDQLSRPGTDRRARGVAALSEGGTPLPASSVVYLAQVRGTTSSLWTEVTTQENLAAVQANSEQFELRTLFTVPVDDVSRAPIGVVHAAVRALDQVERRRAKAERRASDRHPTEELEWEGELGLLAMKAAANDLQAAVELAEKSSLKFTQVRTADATQAIKYIKYLIELAGKAQTGAQQAGAEVDTETLAGQDWKAPASQSQAVPSELASLKSYNSIVGEECYRAVDVQSLFSHSAATGKVPEGWKLVPVEMTKEMRDAANRSSYIDKKNWSGIYSDIIAASPAAPLAGKAEPVAREDQGRKAETAYPSQVRQALTLAMAICDAVPSRAHEAPEDDPLRSIGKLVNYQEDTGLHGYAVIRDALEAIARDTAPLAAAVPAEEASEVEYELHQNDEWVAGASGKNAYNEIMRYAAQYGQDGPVEVVKVVRTKLTSAEDVAPAEPAPIHASALTFGEVQQFLDRKYGFLAGDERVQKLIDFFTARLSKPTAQGTASIDTPEFRELLESAWVASPLAPSGKKSARDRAFDTLIAHIDRHIAAQAPADRDAQMLANVIDYLVANGHMRWRGGFDTDEPFTSDNEEFQTILDLVCRALPYRSQPAASHGAVEGEQNEGGAK